LSLKPDLVLEIGARQAELTWNSSNKLPLCSFICMEANPHSFHKFKNRFAERKNVSYLNLAASNFNGITTIKIPIKEDSVNLTRGSASLASRTDFNGDYKEEKVSCIRLDDHLRTHDFSKAAAWIDVEGSLNEVLEGAATTLTKLDAIFVEVEEYSFWDKQLIDVDVFKILIDYGFVPIARDREYKKTIQCDFYKTESRKSDQERTVRIHPPHAD
jgi:FkbM family methyltransferase